MFIEKNVIKLAVVLVSCDLIRFRLSVNGREPPPPETQNIQLTCGASCISMLMGIGFFLLFSNDTVIYSIG